MGGWVGGLVGGSRSGWVCELWAGGRLGGWADRWVGGWVPLGGCPHTAPEEVAKASDA